VRAGEATAVDQVEYGATGNFEDIRDLVDGKEWRFFHDRCSLKQAMKVTKLILAVMEWEVKNYN
jgi:hypothetical protein